MPRKDPCQRAACEIQKCLQANNYIEDRCKDVLQAMQNCCEVHKGKLSICCSGFRKEQETESTEQLNQTELLTKKSSNKNT